MQRNLFLLGIALLIGAFLAGCTQNATSTIDGVEAYWEEGKQPPTCAAEGDGISITAIAQDDNRRFDEQGVFKFQWKSSDGWIDFKRSPTNCANQQGDFFCTVSTSYSVSNETAINGRNWVRGLLVMENGTATTTAIGTSVVDDPSDCK